ncbi:uncharacterized protein N7483_000116 [Penicillium malachiteum]|uniref:uncharacterized protein n=1 Tax=Penicillium malachiteum TaxID=1324776 RepID=UPI002546AF9A|nr:uncharacterized protein N7483_000116 [Penicillium malachiteum]KAJ5734991.1 hypothetical protein N7483_000116 [Penicillium malachiteum]
MQQHPHAAQANVRIRIRIQITALLAASRPQRHDIMTYLSPSVLPSYPTVALLTRSVSSYIADMLQWELYEFDK